ncbi:MAG: HEPN domain-containing protein [Nitrospirae bacterium]|nr:HEPN domain-containing protein [Nitrospirota bacterium]MCL5978041.1 HEPN domain-containing protein [Nitrospirota bacterium]
MTDKETLFLYRLKQAEETLAESERMAGNNFSPRSIINRAYYSMFYAVLALFLKAGINTKTSKHGGIISLFDREFVKAGKIDKRYSKILHDTFDARQEGDYKEFVELSQDDAAEFVKLAKEFFEEVKNIINK